MKGLNKMTTEENERFQIGEFTPFSDRPCQLMPGVKELPRAETMLASCVVSTAPSAMRVEILRCRYGANLQVGGSGVDLRLRLAPEIEALAPDYSLYPELEDRALGFLTRGSPTPLDQQHRHINPSGVRQSAGGKAKGVRVSNNTRRNCCAISSRYLSPRPVKTGSRVEKCVWPRCSL
jgi:hypothetical protein